MVNEPRPARTAALVLVVTGIVALSFNLRPAAVSVGPVLDEITGALHMSGAVAGVLTSLPVIAFAVFGALAPRLASSIGPHRVTLLALCCVVVGLWLRSIVDDAAAFLVLSLLALAGMATANVLLPPLIKQHFPERVGTMTAVYTTAMAIGLTSASLFTVPLGDALGDWRDGLRFWAFAALVAVLPWLLLSRHDAGLERTETGIRFAQVARTSLGRRMALLFGLQSLQAYALFGWFADVYRDAGFSAHTAGLLLGLITGVSIPLSLVIPSLTARLTSQAPLFWVLVTLYPVSYLGLIIAPHGGAVVWAILVGTAACTFPMVLTLIGLRARTPEGTTALSGFSQSVGYLFSVIGPFGFGALHQLTGGWTVPLLGLTALSVPLLLVGLSLSEPEYVEDELAALER